MKQQYSNPVALRFPVDLKQEIERLAIAEDRTFSAQVVHLLKRALKKPCAKGESPER